MMKTALRPSRRRWTKSVTLCIPSVAMIRLPYDKSRACTGLYGILIVRSLHGAAKRSAGYGRFPAYSGSIRSAAAQNHAVAP
jgi:hypothetical protein